MANIKSAKKRILTNAKNAESNKVVRTNLRSTVKKAELALEQKEDNSAQLVAVAIEKLDRASGRHILHRNTAARKKSQLQRKLNAAG